MCCEKSLSHPTHIFTFCSIQNQTLGFLRGGALVSLTTRNGGCPSVPKPPATPGLQPKLLSQE